MAPELLLRKPHSAAVDWWGLGVCLYEFVTGVPPFSDDTPEKVFENILALRLEWPSESDGDDPLSEEVVEAIMSLLTLDPDKRSNLVGLKNLCFFRKGAKGKYSLLLLYKFALYLKETLDIGKTDLIFF